MAAMAGVVLVALVVLQGSLRSGAPAATDGGVRVGGARLASRPLLTHGSHVLIAGDSIFHHARVALADALRTRGWQPTVVAVPGSSLRGGGLFPVVDWPRELAQEARRLQPDVVVVELGTNGCGTPCSSISAAIDRDMQGLRLVPLVLWLDVRDDGAIPPHPVAINDALERARSRWPNLGILDMNALFHTHPGWIGADNVHPTPAGGSGLARFVADALDRFAA
jgi:lysophospholipase L1-like esterase